MKTLSIRIRLTLWYALALALAMGTLTTAMYAAMRNALEADLDANVRRTVLELAERVTHEFGEGESAVDASAGIAGAAPLYGFSFEIYGPGGERLVASAGLGDHTLGRALPPGGGPRLGGEVVRARLDDDSLDGAGVEIAAVAVEHPRDRSVYTLVAGAGRSPLASTLALMRRLAFTLVPLLVLLAVAGGGYLASRALEPVATMAAQARRMGADRLAPRLAVPNPDDELGRLATTFNELLDRIEAAFNRMRQFVADASHELRTPVAIIRSGTAVALTAPVTLEECYETLKVIDNQTARLGRLVDDMFTLARADAGDPVLALDESAPICELVASCAAAALPVAIAAGVDLRIAPLPDREAYCRGDRGRLEQLVMNLLTNAIRYAGHDGRVDAGVQYLRDAAADVAEISIADTGPGIPLEDREAVFERFVRLDTARSRDTGGGGLGLAIARWVAESHGGKISVDESPSGGALLRVQLPIELDRVEPSAVEHSGMGSVQS
jgi:signal transduction histidine kinase